MLKTQEPDFKVLIAPLITEQIFGVELENSSDRDFESGILKLLDPRIIFKLFKVCA
jgi:hypothetical protein